jgi:Holliday junction resolvase RusA-like endonuclease
MKTITLPLPPTLNHSYGYRSMGRHVSMYKKPEAKQWQRQAALLIQASRHQKTPTKSIVTIKIHMYYKFNRDIDSSLKLLFDTMEGIVYENDRQIISLLVFKDKDKDNPRLEVGIEIERTNP